MLVKTKLEPKNIEDYKKFLSESKYNDLVEKAGNFKGKKIIHINATPKGGGVAEILNTLVPLQQSLGLNSTWYTLEPDLKLFEITKKMHNSLQGGEIALTQEEKDYYLDYNKRMAETIDKLQADILMIHDPQPLPSIEFIKNKVPSVIRIHIDSTKPNPDTRDFVNPFIAQYDRIVYSLPDFVPGDLPEEKIIISPPAIDPLSAKNIDIEPEICNTILLASGVHPDKPLVTQVSRFDTWKDPLGVLEAYYIIKNEVPDLQLILLGVMEAQDDPEAMDVYSSVEKAAKGDPDVFLIYQPEQLGGTEMGIYVNAIQRKSDVVFQKSIREGFGLTVTEAMWKNRPVIGGNVGGIKLQIEDGVNGFLVDSPKEAAEKALRLLKEEGLTEKIGQAAHETVKERFLITRLLGDEFKIMESIV